MTISRSWPVLLVLAALTPQTAVAACPTGSIEVWAAASGDQYGAISSALASSTGSVEICVKPYAWHWTGSPPSAPAVCAGGYYYDNVDATGREVQIYPEYSGADICIQSENAPTTMGGPSENCVDSFASGIPAPYGYDEPTFLFDDSGTSSLGPFTQIYNTHGDAAIHVEDTALTIGQTGYSTGISSPGGTPSYPKWTALSAATDAEVTLLYTSITDSAIGIFAEDNATIDGSNVSIVGMDDRGMELLGTSTTDLNDFHLTSNLEIARICDSHVADWEYTGVTSNGNTTDAYAMGVHVMDGADLDLHNALFRDNALHWDDDKGLVTVHGSATVEITSATFDDNDAWAQVAWYNTSTVDIENSIFSDTSGVISIGDTALFCQSGSGSASHVNIRPKVAPNPEGIDYPLVPSHKWSATSFPGKCTYSSYTTVDPLFTTRTSSIAGSWYLCPNSSFTGCTGASPMIDAGSATASTYFSSSSPAWTTDPDEPQTADTGTVDLGFHYPDY